MISDERHKHLLIALSATRLLGRRYTLRAVKDRKNAMDTISFERERAWARSDAMLPAATYNLARALLAASRTGNVFVPIRAMQYLAVIDPEEIIFVDGQYKRWVAVAWRGFRPQARAALDEAVAYQAVYYDPDGDQIQRRLQSEIHKAVAQRVTRQRPHGGAHILAWPAAKQGSVD